MTKQLLKYKLDSAASGDSFLMENPDLSISMLNMVDGPVALLDRQGQMVFANDAFRNIEGPELHELLEQFLSGHATEKAPEAAGDTGLPANSFEFVFRSEDKAERHLEIKAGPVKTSQGYHILITGRDMTEIKRSEREQQRIRQAYQEQNNIILDSNTQLEKALTMLTQSRKEMEDSRQQINQQRDESPYAVMVHDRNGKILEVNNHSLALLGCEEDNIIGRKIFHFVPEEERRRFTHHIQTVRTAGALRFESKFKKADGAVIDLDISSSVIDPKHDIIKTEARDITDMVKTREQLQQAQIISSLGMMTSGIAHEVNNPLGSILLYSELMLQSDDPSQSKKDLRVIHAEAKRAARIITCLLEYTKGGDYTTRKLNMHTIINNVLRIRRYEQKVQNISSYTNLADGPLYVSGNSPQLAQVIMNIVLNAEEALGEKGGVIVVTTRTEKDWAIISVSDDGGGIPENDLRQIFYPFFTTKKIGEGTGMGLSSCFSIITAHGGLINAVNNERGGATFNIEIPLWKSKHEKKLGKNCRS